MSQIPFNIYEFKSSKRLVIIQGVYKWYSSYFLGLING